MEFMSPLHLIAFGMPGTSEMIILLGIALVIFGPKKLPQLARAIGDSITEFKDAMSGRQRVIEEDDDASKEVEKSKKIDADANAAENKDD